MILPMHRVEIVALKEVFPRVLAFLHERGVLHITPMADVPAPLRGRLARVRLSEDADRDRTRLEAMVTAIDDLLGPEAREPLSDRVAMAGREPTDALHARFTTLIQDLHHLRDHLAHLRDDLRMLPHYERLVEAFLSIKYAFAHRVDWAMVGLILEKRWEQDIGSLREEIARVTRGRMELSVATLDADRLAAIVFYDTRFEKDLEALIWGKGVDRIVLP
ncbi:MAG: hypothetical protein HY660_02985, partial [Armatimonadetes bacterium]|nr:hypothetical protein [Armatimonadota bacterium]